jgi:hypothetical protein
MPNNLQPGLRTVEDGVFTQQFIAELVDIESDLREEPTTARRKTYTEHPYDFPNQYIDMPVRVWTADPASTYAANQNLRFQQRYGKK